MRGVYYFDVALVIEIPNLFHEGYSWVNEPRYIFLEAAYSHGVGECESQGMMKLHFLPDILEIIIPQEARSSGVMWSKGSHIQHIVVLD
jgi:hypothetical protein